jgi:hypothetical protein
VNKPARRALALGLSLVLLPWAAPSPAVAAARDAPALAAGRVKPLVFGVTTELTTGRLTRVDEIEADTRTPVGVVQWFQSFPQALLTDRATNVAASGRIPLVTWQPGITDGGTTQPRYTLKSIADGRHDDYLRDWGRALAALPGPVWLRFAPEMNGDWVPWSEAVNGNTPGSFVRAWRHVHDVVRSAGAHNAVWMWCPNIPHPHDTALPGLYPGDAYVDLVGLDGYNAGTTRESGWRGYHEIFDPGIAQLKALTGRDIVIAEVASVEQGGDKAAWIGDFFRAVDADARIRAVIWFDINEDRDYRIDSSASSVGAFRSTLPALLTGAGR